jgi:tetratricopeptide (TPR) repeat protein
MCFEDAHQVDRRFAEPLAGIALTSITLAAQSPTEKSLNLIVRAREAVSEALALDPTSIDARLAGAMLDWQTTNRYQQAERTLHELSMVVPNNWQVLHQYGLLQLATGQFSKAALSLREASQINPWSVMAKVDRARALWFSGNARRAIQDASRIKDKHRGNLLARGLLVDIFEHQQQYDLAILEHDAATWNAGNSDAPVTADEYFRKRRERLIDLPYGPFGVAMNAAILQSRTREGIDDLQLAEIADSIPPMLPLLLAAHPSFHAARLLERAREILPASVG